MRFQRNAFFFFFLVVGVAACGGEPDVSDANPTAVSDNDASESVAYLTAEDFEQKVLKSERPVLVDFTADWCAPCKIVDPIIEGLAPSMAGRAEIFKVDIDDEEDLYRQFGVNGVPHVLFYFKGAEQARISGPQTREVYLAFLEDLIENGSTRNASVTMLRDDAYRRYFLATARTEDVEAARALYPGLLLDVFENGQTPLSLILNSPSPMQNAKIDLALNEGAEISVRDLVGLGRCQEFNDAITENPDLVNETDPDGVSPLKLAMLRSYRLENQGCLELVLAAEPDLSEPASTRTPLARSAVLLDNLDLFERLLDRGMSIQTVDQEGRNALHWAVQYGRADMVGALLVRGADPRAKTLKGETAMDMAKAARERILAYFDGADVIDASTQERLARQDRMIAMLEASPE